MDTHRLDALPGGAAGMLDGIGVHAETMNIEVRRIAVLACKNISKSRPTTGRRLHVGMSRASSIWEASRAARTSCHRHFETFSLRPNVGLDRRASQVRPKGADALVRPCRRTC